MADLTDFRRALQAELQYVMGIEFFGGMISGPVPDRDVGCCWTAGFAPSEDNEYVAAVDVRVRVLLRTPGATEEFSRRDPDLLETAGEDLAMALQAVKATLSGAWFFSVRAFELDLEENGVEAALLVYRRNPAI
jgi:hypothetical protein